MKIILDAMGGDNAPKAIVKGAIDALREFKDVSILLTGDENRIKECLSEFGASQAEFGDRLEIVHTTQTIEMSDPPVEAIRRKKDSSMVVGLNMARDGKGDVFISAGSTGSLMAGATFIVKRLPGIHRPALATLLPKANGRFMLIDCGANVDCKPQYLQEFAIMGSVYMEKMLGIKNPRVGLVNNGAEEEKGNALAKEAYQLLKNTDIINFAGNAEGRDILLGDFDVIVCDGFVGNVIMKSMEGMAKAMSEMLKSEIKASKSAMFGMLFAKGALNSFKSKLDYREYGGALMLGVNSGVIKLHGSSDERAVFTTIKQARDFAEQNIIESTKAGLEQIYAEK